MKSGQADSRTTITQCSLCRNFQHCTAAGYCNCGAYGARVADNTVELIAEIDRLREAIRLALGFHQTTHIHAALREALK